MNLTNPVILHQFRDGEECRRGEKFDDNLSWVTEKCTCEMNVLCNSCCFKVMQVCLAMNFFWSPTFSVLCQKFCGSCLLSFHIVKTVITEDPSFYKIFAFTPMSDLANTHYTIEI